MADKKPFIEREGVQNYLKYSGLGFQLVGLLLIAWFAGSYLDEKYSTDTPYWTAGIMLVSVILFIVYLILKLLREEENPDDKINV